MIRPYIDHLKFAAVIFLVSVGGYSCVRYVNHEQKISNQRMEEFTILRQERLSECADRYKNGVPLRHETAPECVKFETEHAWGYIYEALHDHVGSAARNQQIIEKGDK